MKKYINEYNKWLDNTRPETDIYDQLLNMRKNEEEIYESFYKDLAFGTSGLRGIMAPGTNRMNIYVVCRATQGLANYLKENYDDPTVVISYDSRINSRTFAENTAGVLSANKIKTFIHTDIMPVSVLSFATRKLGGTMGIMITASHNSKEYNGYKVYDSDGCQIRNETAEGIFECIKKVDIFKDIKFDIFAKANFDWVPKEVEDGFVLEAYNVTMTNEDLSKLKLIYTPLNGAGRKPVLKLLKKANLGNVCVVSQQEKPDGTFPTCPLPNPEYDEVYKLAEDLCNEKKGDLIIATDPDCDRMGISVRKGNTYKKLSGNQIAVLLFDYLCKKRKMPKGAVAVRSIVSTPQIDKIALTNNVNIETCLIGFKYIGEKINELKDKYVFGFEEGNGYLVGNFVRDKDGVSSTLLACQMAAYHKKRGHTLIQALEEIGKEYGFFREKVLSFVFEGSKGAEKMTSIMDKIRKESRKDILGKKPIKIVDYMAGEQYIVGNSSKCDMIAGTKPTGLPKENIMEFVFEDESKIIIRPSGTEPKIKVYLFSCSDSNNESKMIIEDNVKKIKKVLKNE